MPGQVRGSVPYGIQEHHVTAVCVDGSALMCAALLPQCVCVAVHVQEMIGTPPSGFLRFFTSRFPRLLLAAYCFGLQNLGSAETLLQHYWPSAASCRGAFLQVSGCKF